MQLASAEEQVERLEVQLKALNNRVDELSGKNRSLEDEKNLYKVRVEGDASSRDRQRDCLLLLFTR